MQQTKSPGEVLLEALESLKVQRKVSLDEVLVWEKAHERLRDRAKNEFLREAIDKGLLEIVEDRAEQGEDQLFGQYTAYFLKLKAPDGTSIYLRPLGRLKDSASPRVGVWGERGGFTLWWKGDDNWLIEPVDAENAEESTAVPLTKELFLAKMLQVVGA